MMLSIAFLGLLALFDQAACSVQNPPITECPGVTKPIIQVKSVTITGAELGQTIKIDTSVVLTAETGNNPVLDISLYTVPGNVKIPCIRKVLPCSLQLCDGTTEIEKTFNQAWGNTCPVKPGNYNALLTYTMPGSLFGQENFGTGEVTVVAEVLDGQDVLSCVTFPMVVELN